MDRVETLFKKLQEQLSQNASVDQLLLTVQMLQSELMHVKTNQQTGGQEQAVSIHMPDNFEKTADTAAIAGKKLYSIFNGSPDDDAKSASKGVRLTPNDIVNICLGETVEYANPVPAFRLGKETKFVTRKIKMTA